VSRRVTRAGALLRWAGADTVRTLREWRPPERSEPGTVEPRELQPRQRASEPTWGRGDAAATVRRTLQGRLLFPLLEVMGRPTVIGAHHLNRMRPPFILAPNHVSHVDAPLVLRALPEHLRERTVVPAAADYFFDRGWLSVLVTLAMNAVPFDRRYYIADSVRRCERFLRSGDNVLLFPEGTRSVEGRLRGFKLGVGHLAVATGAPVVPVYVQGTHALLPRGRTIPRPSAVAVHFGAPLTAGEDEPPRAFNQRLERAVAQLAGTAWGHAYRDRRPPRTGWRESWLASAPRLATAHPQAVEKSWIERWRSTTPR
jgi:1-acyl-sn-glycerol-3-phosphate acyltransferase